MVKKYREDQYEKNCELIDMIHDHRQSDIIMDRIQDVIFEELDIKSSDLLKAYKDGDADAMFCAITGWDFESIMAKAKVIPDVKHQFYSEGAVPASDIDFPRYGKDEWTEQEFMDYFREEFTISVEALRLIQNAFCHARDLYEDKTDQQNFLWSMLQGTIGLDEEIVRKVVL